PRCLERGCCSPIGAHLEAAFSAEREQRRDVVQCASDLEPVHSRLRGCLKPQDHCALRNLPPLRRRDFRAAKHWLVVTSGTNGRQAPQQTCALASARARRSCIPLAEARKGPNKMNRKASGFGTRALVVSPALVAGIVALGCGSPDATDDSTNNAEQAAVGAFLPGLQVTPGLLAEATDAFRAVEGITDGNGPIFNERSCGGCHLEGATGGSGPNTERRFGTFTSGGIFDPLDELGGTLRQLFS